MFSPALAIITCTQTQITLKATSNTPNVNYAWTFQPSPGSATTNTINVTGNMSNPTNSIIGNYSLSVTDNNNLCKSNTVAKVYQNIFPPKALIGPTLNALTCNSPSLALYNMSSTGIPNNTLFPAPYPVIGQLWEGPVPQQSLQNTSSYIAYTPGTYTISVIDLNNGCEAQTVTTVGDNRVYPDASSPSTAFTIPCPGNGVTIAPIINGSPLGLTYSWTSPPNATISSVNGFNITTNTPGFYTVVVTNTVNGCSVSVPLAVYQCVGFDENSNSSFKVNVFPNPGKDLFTIEVLDHSKNLSVEVFNSIGAIIKKEDLIIGKNSLDLQALPAGVYLLQVTQHGKSVSNLKIIKE